MTIIAASSSSIGSSGRRPRAATAICPAKRGSASARGGRSTRTRTSRTRTSVGSRSRWSAPAARAGCGYGGREAVGGGRKVRHEVLACRGQERDPLKRHQRARSARAMPANSASSDVKPARTFRISVTVLPIAALRLPLRRRVAFTSAQCREPFSPTLRERSARVGSVRDGRARPGPDPPAAISIGDRVDRRADDSGHPLLDADQLLPRAREPEVGRRTRYLALLFVAVEVPLRDLVRTPARRALPLDRPLRPARLGGG